MGAWGSGPFENDSAADWAMELADGDDDGPIVDALGAVVDAPPDEYLEVDEGSAVVAAAAVLVALSGRAAKLPEDLAEWVELQPPELAETLLEKHRERALRALARVRGEGSELRELWEESEDAGAWVAHLDRLAAALGAG